MYVGIDLALRSTGIVILADDGSFLRCHLIISDSKTLNNEQLLLHNLESQVAFFASFSKEYAYNLSDVYVGLEGLSFNSTSSSVDLIAANHWFYRCSFVKLENKIIIIPPKSWQKSIITKEVLAEYANTYPTVRAKKGQKLTKEQTAANAKAKAERRKDTKLRIYNSVPEDVRKAFDEYVVANKLKKDVIYDLADAYCIAKHLIGVKK